MSSLFGIGGGGNVGASGSFYGYSIDQSLRFNDNDSAKLYFDPTVDGNKQVWTFSAWVKRGNLGLNYATFFSGTNSSGHQTDIRFDSADQLRVVTATASLTMDFKTNRVFRDVGSWYHIVVAVDTTDATLLNRVKIYVNGVQETSLATTTCTQNTNCILNTASAQTTNVGALGYTTTVNKEFDGYLSEVHFVDGTQYAASDFGETSNNIWVPKEVSGLTYGTNGFYLSFADSAAIGDDLSGNTNDFTVINSVASDVVPDSPTNNWATMNPLDRDLSWSSSEGNLKVSLTGTAGDSENIGCAMSVPSSTPIYFEAWPINTDTGGVGVGPLGMAEISANTTGTTYFYFGASSVGGGNAKVYVNGTVTYDTGANWSSAILGVAVDMANSKVWFSKNGTWLGSGTQDPATNTGGYSISADEVMPYGFKVNSNVTNGYIFNFGQDSTFAGATTAGGNADENGYGDFKYSVPSGFLALNSANLPEPAIGPNSTTTSDEHFNTVLYTGTGASNSITVGFQPDFTWIKRRDATADHQLVNSVVGYPNGTLLSNQTDAEYTAAARVDSRDSNGFTVSTPTQVNASGGTYASWNWKAGGTAVSNTSGSITSSVSANQDAGFSIVSYTGTGSAATVGHGLASAPETYIVKGRAASNWSVYHSGIASDAETDFLILNSTGAAIDLNTYWNDTAPTSSVFSLGTDSNVNANTGTYIAYCFHSVEGHSKVGSYVGNGNANGAFVYTGFRPAFVLLKVSSAVNNWFIYDNKREGYNQDNDTLSPNLTTVEDNSYKLDLVSNGFKIRGSNNAHNQSGQTFIYLAFAEAPFKYANAR